MASSLTQQAVTGGQTPYQVNPDQVLRASQVLSKHIAASRLQQQAESGKRDLLNDSDDEDDDADSVPKAGEEDGAMWVVVGTKKFISDKTRLKPYKISVPHSLHQTSHTSICLIVADPQRRYKDIVADPTFPEALKPLVTRVIGISKLKAKFKSFEARRQLAGEHTHFFADDRIITALPFLLGKVFYKSTAKRPVPVKLTGHAMRKLDKELALKAKKERRSAGNRESALFGTPIEIGNEIKKALSSALVNLSPATTTAVRIGFASWKPEHVRDNVQALIRGLLEPGPDGEVKIVPGGWKNIRSLYLKGAKTISLPLWLADELWAEENDVIEFSKTDAAVADVPAIVAEDKENKAASIPISAPKSKKRKSLDGADIVDDSAAAPELTKQVKKSKKTSTAKVTLEKDVAARKEKLKAQRGKSMSKLLK